MLGPTLCNLYNHVVLIQFLQCSICNNSLRNSYADLNHPLPQPHFFGLSHLRNGFLYVDTVFLWIERGVVERKVRKLNHCLHPDNHQISVEPEFPLLLKRHGNEPSA